MGPNASLSRTSIDRWLAAYAKDGLAGLAPVPRSDRGRPRAARQWLDEAAKLRRAVPARSAAQIVDIIGRAHGVWLSERTVAATCTASACPARPCRPPPPVRSGASRRPGPTRSG